MRSMDIIDKFDDLLINVHDDFRVDASLIPVFWEVNELLLQYLVDSSKLNVTYAILDRSHEQMQRRHIPRHISKASDPPSYDSMEQIIIHLSRDWSQSGSCLREELYRQGIIKMLTSALPTSAGYQGIAISNTSHQHQRLVLVPGSGLGRLAMEMAAVGYRSLQ